MPNTIIDLRGSRVTALEKDADDRVRVRFAPAIVIKSQGIAGVDASTRWTQDGEVLIQEAELEGAPAALPSESTGGSMECGGIKYLDMIPLPLDLAGFAELRLRFADAEVTVRGERPRATMEGSARYVEHVQETQPQG